VKTSRARPRSHCPIQKERAIIALRLRPLRPTQPLEILRKLHASLIALKVDEVERA
jgi:hypothetical protein